MYAKAGLLLCLAVLGTCSGRDIATLGDKEYSKTVLLKQGAWNHIIIHNDIMLYIRRTDKQVFTVNCSTALPTPVVVGGLEGIAGQDLAAHPSGVVWLATSKGLYTVDPTSRIATYVTGKEYNMERIAITPAGIVYVTSSGYVLLELRDQVLHTVPGIQTHSLTFSGEGDIYYTTVSNGRTVYRKKGGVHGRDVMEVAELPDMVWMLELDRKSKVLYSGRNNHLFFVPAGSSAVATAGGVGETSAIGTDSHGNVYTGSNSEIYRLSPLPSLADVLQAVGALSSKHDQLAADIGTKLVAMEKKINQAEGKVTAVMADMDVVHRENRKLEFMLKDDSGNITKQVEDQWVLVTNRIDEFLNIASTEARILLSVVASTSAGVSGIRLNMDQKFGALEKELTLVSSCLQGVCAAGNTTESAKVCIPQR